MKIVVTRRLFPEQVQRLSERFEVEVWHSDLPPNEQELDGLLNGADGALTLLTDRVDGDLLDRHPSIKVVSNLAVGFDNINVPDATNRGVAVCTTPDVLTDTTAEFTIALILDAARHLTRGDRAARAGDWLTWYPMRFLGTGLSGSTLGIIGYGRIGQKVAAMASALGMNVVVTDSGRQQNDYIQVELNELLATSTIISLHTPLTPSTRHLIGGAQMALMRDDAILVNTARGPIIDTNALVSALDDGKFAAVALDVTDPEPLPADHQLYTFDRVIITPHIASATIETRTEMTRLAIDNIIAVLQGDDPPNCLNPEVLQRD